MAFCALALALLVRSYCFSTSTACAQQRRISTMQEVRRNTLESMQAARLGRDGARGGGGPAADVVRLVKLCAASRPKRRQSAQACNGLRTRAARRVRAFGRLHRVERVLAGGARHLADVVVACGGVRRGARRGNRLAQAPACEPRASAQRTRTGSVVRAPRTVSGPRMMRPAVAPTAAAAPTTDTPPAVRTACVPCDASPAPTCAACAMDAICCACACGATCWRARERGAQRAQRTAWRPRARPPVRAPRAPAPGCAPGTPAPWRGWLRVAAAASARRSSQRDARKRRA